MNILESGHDWMDLLQDRNLTAHTYDEQKATDVEQLTSNKYFSLLNALRYSFKQKLDKKRFELLDTDLEQPQKWKRRTFLQVVGVMWTLRFKVMSSNYDTVS
jgi:S-adenosylmethionine/arginine decarboxylase-like enzyme